MSKIVVLIATGGTIASTEDATEGAVNATLSGGDLLARLHDRPEGVSIREEAFGTLGSYALDLETVHRLCRRIAVALEQPEVAGVVVTHGTDTMEESAYLSDILVASEKPVVFTGAQRHAGEPDTDGPRNIGDAIRCAASEALKGCGTVILFEGDIHAARDVSKTHTSRVDAFRSAGLGKLGEVDGGEVYLYRRPIQGVHIATKRLESRIALMLLGLGSSPEYLDFCLQNGTKAVVLAAFGRGNAPRGFADAVRRLSTHNIPVIVASRCPEGRTLPVYGRDSGGSSLAAAGAYFSGSLSPIKARLLMSALLGAGVTSAELATKFREAVGTQV
ncbi:asparaginase [Salipiger abyssi]|uniref:asparaginase n=1 Tax=Salipiger abyssi TaxID=1250539 RepID=UPI001A8EF408|nr:asparaginase [Salipiger abyssi]MBN9888008.1 asparaginase [Salipiger abyssi]